jgi:hypothetical protein
LVFLMLLVLFFLASSWCYSSLLPLGAPSAFGHSFSLFALGVPSVLGRFSSLFAFGAHGAHS